MRIRVLVMVFMFLFMGSVRNLHAQEFRTDYDASYVLPANIGEDARVRLKITLTNLKIDTYVDTYSLTFPASFEIYNVAASDDAGAVEPVVSQSDDGTIVELKANVIHVGPKVKTTFVIDFSQKNLFRRTGSVWEVTLPTVGVRKDGSYKIALQVPPDNQKLSIAKPKPTRNEGTTIEWENPQEKIIYAVFGTKQTYKVALGYDLENAEQAPKQISIALPPDTLYQKMYIDSLEPQPSSYSVDIDGNFLAQFDLEPKSTRHIVYNGFVEVFAQPRDELRSLGEQSIQIQKAHLLEPTQYWSLLPSKTIEALKTPKKINDYVQSTLQYDYTRTQPDGDHARYGAKRALLSPEKAVCLEYTDSFIAIARTNGIYAREIQGYAVTDNEKFRPVSLANDILHSWPEYFDTNAGLWRQLDPTWGDTSGIDYFESFDLNHIALAIHGANSTEPLPAGMYKTTLKKNISVAPSPETPTETSNIRVVFDSLDMDTSINDGKEYNGSFEIVNSGNTFRYDMPITLESGGLRISPPTVRIPIVAPGMKARAEFRYRAREKKGRTTTTMTATADDTQLFIKSFSITSSSYFITIGLGVVMIILFGGTVIVMRKYVVRSRNNHN